jgi:hypothetical protein
MPRSKFATKAYGPTKPAICEKQILPPGVLPKGPGEHNTAFFLFFLGGTGGYLFPAAGTAVLTRTANPDRYEGHANVGNFALAITLVAFAPIYWPKFDVTLTLNGVFQWATTIYGGVPKSIDPYDTGIVELGGPGPLGTQMIRAVATD